jgi:phospholipid/cholesterol/gamma-HCH transport system substrate-binding protein
MNSNLRSAMWRFLIFSMITAVCAAGLVLVFAQLRFQPEKTYTAEFTNVSGLQNGDFVRIAGVEVGKVKRITIRPDTVAIVDFSADDTVVLTQGTRAVIRYTDLIGGRFLALEQGVGGVNRLSAGQTIPLQRTQPALDLDALIGGFRPLFRALDPDQVNQLSGQLIEAFQGQGGTITSVLSQTAALTNTLADRDDLIGQVVDNLKIVLGSLADQRDQVSNAVGSLSQLVDGLSARRNDIASSVGASSSAAASIAGLLAHARAPLAKTIHETDRFAAIAVADHEYLDNLLKTLPDAYQALGRQGINGDFFSFYLCQLMLKVNGKGGQPVYILVANQPSGRCTPR